MHAKEGEETRGTHHGRVPRAGPARNRGHWKEDLGERGWPCTSGKALAPRGQGGQRRKEGQGFRELKKLSEPESSQHEEGVL